jgi:UDP-N-acetylglucosamine acyltransferase
MGSSVKIHPTAIIDGKAQLADDVTVGAYTVIKGPVTIGSGTVVHEHCVLLGGTVIGNNCRIGPGAYVGTDPQHLRFVPDDSMPTYLVIGNNVIIREAAHLNRASRPGLENATRIGDHCFIMGTGHVGHDCVVEPHVVLADGAMLGGHCHIGERAFLGGGCAIHQFVRVGRLCIVSGNEATSQDIPPFGAMRYGRLKGYNAVGCRRSGMSREEITVVRGVYQRLKNIRTMSAILASIRAELPDLPVVQEIVSFIESSRRGILPAHRGVRDAAPHGSSAAEAVED